MKPLTAWHVAALDAIKCAEFIRDRAEELHDTYGVDQEKAKHIVSMLHPREASMEKHTKKANEFLASQFPNLSAAFDAYQQSKAIEDAHRQAEDAMRFPALHTTQPGMYMAQQQMLYGGGDMSAASTPTHHHRRHRRHHS
jgi:hypothetical protein